MAKTSREYTQKLRELADWLDARPDFKMDAEPYSFFYYYTAEDFKAAVLALKPGKKELSEGEYAKVTFRPFGTEISITIPRDKVCRLVRKEKWECEPLLSAEDERILAE